jgi:hypothetical protein
MSWNSGAGTKIHNYSIGVQAILAAMLLVMLLALYASAWSEGVLAITILLGGALVVCCLFLACLLYEAMGRLGLARFFAARRAQALFFEKFGVMPPGKKNIMGRDFMQRRITESILHANFTDGGADMRDKFFLAKFFGFKIDIKR